VVTSPLRPRVICIAPRYTFDTGHRPSASLGDLGKLRSIGAFQSVTRVTVSFDETILMPASPLSA